MKYKYLSQEELQHLEEELLQFLIVNGIDGPTWQKMNEEEPKKAIELVGLFSDLVWQRSLEKVQYGEQIINNQYLVFEFRNNEIEMFGLRSKTSENLKSAEEFMNLLKSIPASIELLHHVKSYNEPREKEIFFMMNNGLLLSSKSNFDFLKNLYNNV